MGNPLSLDDARQLVMGLSYPPTTLTIDTPKAVGHRLAKAVPAKGNVPSRPVALVDGLAVLAADVVASELVSPPAAEPAAPEQEQPVISGPLEPVGEAEEPGLEEERGSLEEAQPPLESPVPDPPAPEAPPEPPPASALEPTVQLNLRPFPETNRREDALSSGQAIAVPVGGEVPRGGELVYPLGDLVPAPADDEAAGASAPPAAPERERQPTNGGDDNGDDDGDLPVAEPPRDWDLPARFLSGTVELPRTAQAPPPNMIPIGSWARNRETLVAERTVLRPAEMALLMALGIEEVTIYRRPVVGVVSLGLPFPEAGRTQDAVQSEGVCPLAILAAQLMRAARVAALPLGFAPKRFHELVSALGRWAGQVDLLLLVGGSHHGPRCRGLDALRAAGRVEFSGLTLTPGGALSVGRIGSQPVFVMPGSLADVLVGCVLLARPLAHKYLTPHQYEDQQQLELEYGSHLSVERTTAVPVRYGFDEQRGVFTTRYDGRGTDEWLDYIRGQALVVLEGGRRYTDGETVTAYKY